MNGFIIRDGTSGDSAAISELTLATCRQFLFPDLSQEGRNTLLKLYGPDSIREKIEAGDRYALVFSGAALAAAAAMRPHDFHIYLFFVDGRFHRQGLGRVLMDALVPANLEYEKLTLNSSLYARDFYARLGFVATDEPFESKGVTSVPMQCTPGVKFLT